MKTYLSTSGILKFLYPRSLVWNIPQNDKVVYLTFDDGPTPGVTDDLLNLLNRYNAKASFFCIGKNVLANSSLFERIKAEGHTVGNHTWSHENGKKVSSEEFLSSIEKTNELTQSNLFRPPYGRIRIRQAKQLAKKYKIIMWSVLAGDFDQSKSKEACLKTVLKYAKPGSILVFHDSVKASEKMLYSVEGLLKYLSNQGYQFNSILAD